MVAQKLIERNRDILGGTPVFAGTRVPVQTVIDYLEAGHRLDDFLEDFPTVGRANALAVLKSLKQLLLTQPDESFT